MRPGGPRRRLAGRRGRPPGGRGRGGAPAAGGADQDRGGAPEPPQPGSGVRRQAARRAHLFPQAGLRAVGHGGAVVRPANCRYLNYEGEVAIVIGRACRGVPPDRPGDYIAGYTIANDFGLHDFRDTDAGSMLRVKGSDTMAPLGPGLVTGWDFHGKRLRTYVNGARRAGRINRRDAVGHALPGRRHRPHDHAAARRRAAVRHACQLPAGAARRRVSGGSGRAGNADQPRGRRAAAGRGGLGAQPTASEEVISTALGGDWEFRGIRPPARS